MRLSARTRVRRLPSCLSISGKGPLTAGVSGGVIPTIRMLHGRQYQKSRPSRLKAP